MRIALLFLVSLYSWLPAAAAESTWIEGQHYFRIEPAQATHVPAGKVELVEVFSYACPACNLYNPLINKLKAQLPAKAQLSYLPASWHPEEDWKTFQRAFFAAQSLGLVERTHDAVYEAIWKSSELAIMDPETNRPKRLLPTIAEVARWYARTTQLTAEAFLAAAQSFSVDALMRQADEQIRAYQADATPTIVVNGKYRLTPRSAGSDEQFISLVNWLVSKEMNQH
ncbi:MAG: thiol:disulfide interchange protein DsbA/DsbL [Steroidobacteraceae bacterium]